MELDRDRFLFLVVALSSPYGCNQGPVPTTAGGIATVYVPPPVATEAHPPTPRPVAEPPSVPEPVAASTRCAVENDTGTVDCSRIRTLRLGGPACEGAESTCDLLAQGYAYRPHAAEVAAACLDRLGSRVCDIQARKKCYEEGVRSACPEPQFEARCEGAIERCEAARIRPQYTKEECVQAMSAQKGPDRDWPIGAMGPSSEGKCQLMFTVF